MRKKTVVVSVMGMARLARQLSISSTSLVAQVRTTLTRLHNDDFDIKYILYKFYVNLYISVMVSGCRFGVFFTHYLSVLHIRLLPRTFNVSASAFHMATD